MRTQYEFEQFRDRIIGYVNYLISFCDKSMKDIEKYRPENSELMNEVIKIREDLMISIKKTNTDEDIKHLDDLGKKIDKIQDTIYEYSLLDALLLRGDNKLKG
jgi:predicted translin family RNA/ssDNA-binding protein